MPEPIAIVYDGDCAFCRRSLRALQRLDGRGVMQLYESRALELIAARFPMLAGADFDNAMFAVTSDGRVFRGYFAFKEVLRTLPAAWPLLLLCYLPGASAIGPRIYAWVARNRGRLGCGSEVCELPAPPPTSPRDGTPYSMNVLFGAEPFLYPSLGPAVLYVIRTSYGLLLVATLLGVLPHARRYFLSERWGGYGQQGRAVDSLQNPVVLPLLLMAWLAAAVALVIGRHVVVAAIVNMLLCRYFFIQMRWRGVLRGMGAPGFIAYWLGVAVLLLEYTRRAAPALQGLALLVLQVDFAFIMLSAGFYKFAAGYRQNEGMELGMVNPEWGYWPKFWGRMRPGAPVFRLFNKLAWSTEVGAAVLMLLPPTRLAGGMAIMASFVFIATQIRLGFLCEMVIVCCLVFAHPGSVIDVWLGAAFPQSQAVPAGSAPPLVTAALGAGLWVYLVLLPLARAALSYNLYARKALPVPLQRIVDAYANAFGLIAWRVFSADITNFFIRIFEQPSIGARRLISRWGETLRFNQVAESIAVTTLFTTLKYYPGNDRLFTERLLRYARTVPCDPGSTLVFEYVSVLKRDDRFDFVPVAEYVVDSGRRSVLERVLDHSVSVHAAAAASPIHEAARPGSYAPLGH